MGSTYIKRNNIEQTKVKVKGLLGCDYGMHAANKVKFLSR